MYVILSVKPRYCEAIALGMKRYEFRRRIFKDIGCIQGVYIYSTAPIKRLVGEFQIGEVISGKPENVWRQCKKNGGVNKDEFFAYFDNTNIAYAMEIDKLRMFDPLDPKDIFNEFNPPQSFCYIERSISM